MVTLVGCLLFFVPFYVIVGPLIARWTSDTRIVASLPAMTCLAASFFTLLGARDAGVTRVSFASIAAESTIPLVVGLVVSAIVAIILAIIPGYREARERRLAWTPILLTMLVVAFGGYAAALHMHLLVFVVTFFGLSCAIVIAAPIALCSVPSPTTDVRLSLFLIAIFSIAGAAAAELARRHLMQVAAGGL